MKYSIIVPIYNVEKYLDKCLNSITNQNHHILEKTEIILIDDGSTDLSKEIILHYINNYQFINWIFLSKENGGVATARNVGIKKSTGEYLAFLDSDDFLENNFLLKIDEVLKNNDIDLLVYDAFSIGDAKCYFESISCETGYVSHKDYFSGIVCPWNKVVKRNIIIDNNISFPTNLWYEDLATTPLFACFTNKIFYLKLPLINYVHRIGSAIQQVEYNDKYQDIFKIIEILKKFESGKYINHFEYIIVSQLLYYSAERFWKFKKKDLIKKSVSICKNTYPTWYKNENIRKHKNLFIVSYLVYLHFFRLAFLLDSICKKIKKRG